MRCLVLILLAGLLLSCGDRSHPQTIPFLATDWQGNESGLLFVLIESPPTDGDRCRYVGFADFHPASTYTEPASARRELLQENHAETCLYGQAKGRLRFFNNTLITFALTHDNEHGFLTLSDEGNEVIHSLARISAVTTLGSN
jgi:hypothetical protein